MSKINEETKQHLAQRISDRKQHSPPVDDPIPTSELVVIARNPSEMQVAQQKLVHWAAAKVGEVTHELAEAEETLQTAADNAWKLSGFQKNVKLHKDRLKYYTKVHAALAAGYVIVPNFDLDIFAIRTTKRNPKNEQMSRRFGKPHPSEFENKTNRPALGDGSYVNPWPTLEHSREPQTLSDGSEVETNLAVVDEWDAVDFPFKFVKPQIMDDTARAMGLKIFDEIGVSPHRRVRKQDPMVVGQIVYKNAGYEDKRVSFLVTWWVAENDLEV